MNAVFSKRGTSLAEKALRYASQSPAYNELARLSQHVWWLEDLLRARPGIPIALDIRVSSNLQTRRGNHRDAEAEALDLLDALGVTDVRIFHEECKATIPVQDRPVLMQVIQYARERNGAVATVTLDRLIRPSDFNGSNWSNRLELERMQELRRAAAGVPLATIFPPNDYRARGYQTVRGQRAKGNRVGRPSNKTHGPGWTKRRAAELLPLVRKLRNDGLSYVAIAAVLEQARHGYKAVTAKTLWNWLNPGASGV